MIRSFDEVLERSDTGKRFFTEGLGKDIARMYSLENKVSATHRWSSEGWLEPTVQAQPDAAAAYYVPLYIRAAEEGFYILHQASPTISAYNFAMTTDRDNLDALARLVEVIPRNFSEWADGTVTGGDRSGI